LVQRAPGGPDASLTIACNPWTQLQISP
jgi:hypothetical protein